MKQKAQISFDFIMALIVFFVVFSTLYPVFENISFDSNEVSLRQQQINLVYSIASELEMIPADHNFLFSKKLPMLYFMGKEIGCLIKLKNNVLSIDSNVLNDNKQATISYSFQLSNKRLMDLNVESSCGKVFEVT